MKIFRGVVLSFFIIALLSCDAPHLNPLDPLNAGYSFGQLSGNVVDENLAPVSKVKVTFKNSSTVAETDASGNFRMADLPLRDTWLYYEKEGYAKDSVEVNWNNTKNKIVNQKILYSTIGQIEGSIVNPDKGPVSGVKIIFQKFYITESDGVGLFKLQNLPLKDGMLYFEKEGFGKDSMEIKWNGQRVKNISQKTLQYTIGQIEGMVYNSEQLPINGVKVIFNNAYVSYSDGTGTFRLYNLPMADGKVFFEKEGYKKDSVEVKWNGQKIKNIGSTTLAYSIGNIEGFVFNPQRIGIREAKIVFRNNYITQSDAAGQFKFSNLPMTDGWLSVEKNGYTKDSVFVQWLGEKTKRYEIKLNYTSGILDGYVKPDANHNIGLAGVKVLWNAVGLVTYTDNNGYYKFENLSHKDGMLYFEKGGYNKDSAYVQWSSLNENIRVADRYLNAMPVLDYISLYSQVENEQGGFQRFSMTIEAGVTDIDDHIDSVIVKCSALGFYRRLRYNPTNEQYEHTEPNMYTVDEAVGKNFEVIVKDKSKRTFLVGSSTVKRVISKELVYKSPTNGQTVGTKPTFVWERFTGLFNYSYKFQIYYSPAFGLPPEKVYEKENISKEDIQLSLNFDLNPGNYFWVIWCVDDYKNAARSAPASFTVQ